MSVHPGEIDHRHQWRPMKPLTALLRRHRNHEECFSSSVIYLSLGGSLAWDQYATGGSYFTLGPAGMKEKTEGKDGMMTWLCKALRRSAQRTVSLERIQVANKGEERRATFCDVRLNSSAEACRQHGRRHGLTACRFSEFIMNTPLYFTFSPFSLSFILSPPCPPDSGHPHPLCPVTDSCSLSSWE